MPVIQVQAQMENGMNDSGFDFSFEICNQEQRLPEANEVSLKEKRKAALPSISPKQLNGFANAKETSAGNIFRYQDEMASYAQMGLTNEYASNLNVNTHPDSDSSVFSDSDAEHAELMHGKHTVALDGRLEESEVQRGLYNRHNFLVNNFNNVLDHNLMQLRISGTQLCRLLPLGGVRSRHLSSRFEKRNFQNLIAMGIGWAAGGLPPVFMILVAYSRRFFIDFTLLYLTFTFFVMHLMSIWVLTKNVRLFLKSPFMIPVVISSPQLHGLYNNFKDISWQEFANLSPDSCTRQFMLDLMQYRCNFFNNDNSYHSLVNEEADELTVRVMFYSPDYFEKYCVVPRNRIVQLIIVTCICFIASTCICLREIHNSAFIFTY